MVGESILRYEDCPIGLDIDSGQRSFVRQWAAGYDKSAVLLSSLPYTDPNRTADLYDAALGGPGTLADILANAEAISPTNYQPRYMAKAVMDYIRAGFAIDKTAPTATASVTNIGASRAGSSTDQFTVSYTDNLAINSASISANNLLVTGPNGFSQLATVRLNCDTHDLADGIPNDCCHLSVHPTVGNLDFRDRWVVHHFVEAKPGQR